jgi:hypothetical protein
MSIDARWGRRLLERVPARHQWFGAFLLVYAYLMRDVVLGRLYAFGDLPPYVGTQAIELFLSTWHYQQLGFAHQYNTLVGYLGVLTLSGGALAQNLFYLALVPAGFLTFRVFVRRFVEREAALALAAAVYAINPITVGEVVNGGANELLSFVGVPLVLHYLWTVSETDEWRPALAAGAAFGATAVIPWTSFWLLAPFAGVLVYRNYRNLSVLTKFVASGAVGILLSLPSVYYIIQRASGLDATATMFTQVEWNYADATVPALVRLAGNHGSFAMAELGYNSEPTMLVGLVIPAVALLAWPRRRLRFCYAVVTGLVLFAALTRLEVTYPLFEWFPPLWSVRNPAKLQYPIALATSLLFGAGLEMTFTRLRGAENARFVRVALTGLVVLSLFSYLAPAAGGALGLEATRGSGYYVPAEYESVGDELDGRALWVPYSYTTQLRLRHAYPDHVGIQSGGIAQGKANAEYVRTLFADLAAGASVHDRLAALGVQYVVVDSRAQERYAATEGDPRLEIRYSAPWLFGEPETLAERFEDSSDYSRAFSRGNLTVFRVEGVPERDRVETHEGVNRLVYPTEVRSTVISEENRVANGEFDDGLQGWWTHSGENGTRTTAVNTSLIERAALLETPAGNTYPIAQRMDVRDGYPYRVDVDADGPATVTLFWYDGAKSEENLTATTRYAAADLPRTVVADGNTLSLRVRPNATRLLVRSVRVQRTTYPARTGFGPNAAEVPGVVVDERASELSIGSVVAVNVDEERAEAVNASVTITDAETRIEGNLVFDDRYRQGVAVRVDGARPTGIPPDADVVSYDTPEGTVVDYWVVGEFDRTPVTVLDTSYDERWAGPPGAEHFRAYGWANGFTDTAAGEIEWTGGTETRRTVLGVWVFLWALALVVLAVSPARSVLGRLQRRVIDRGYSADGGPPP